MKKRKKSFKTFPNYIILFVICFRHNFLLEFSRIIYSMFERMWIEQHQQQQQQ